MIGLVCSVGSGVGRFLKRETTGATGPIWLTDVECSGDETSVFDCAHKAWGSHYCGHYEDVYVRCNAGESWVVGRGSWVVGRGS